VLAKLNAGPGFWKNLYDNRYLGCCMAFSRDLLDWALPFPRRIPMHDMWLGQLCERIGTTEFLPVVTMQYRKHEASLTEFRIRFMPWLQIKRRWFLLYYLLRRAGGIRSEERGTRNEDEGRRFLTSDLVSFLDPRSLFLTSAVSLQPFRYLLLQPFDPTVVVFPED
jgi:hypothetical protein